MRADRTTPTRPIAVAGAALTAVLAFMIPAHAEARTELACKTDCVQVLVNGLHLSIPRPFFAYPPKEDGSDQGIFLKALLPDIVPATRNNQLAVPSEVWGQGWGPMLNLLIGGLRGATMESTFKARLRGATIEGPHAEWDGLETVTSEDRNQRHDGFVLREGNELKLIIACDMAGTVNFPSCSEFFFYQKSLVKLTFGRSHLAEWRQIRDHTIALINHMTVP